MANVIESYKETEVDSPVLLLEANHVLPPQFIEEKTYTHWRLDIHHGDLFENATELVFENIRKLLKSRRGGRPKTIRSSGIHSAVASSSHENISTN